MNYELKKLNEQLAVLRNEIKETGITAKVQVFAENLADRAKDFDGFDRFIEFAKKIQYS